jgi:fluoride ion exporter CrcB/FEX
MDCSDEPFAPACAVGEEVLPSLMSVLSSRYNDVFAAATATVEDGIVSGSGIHRERQRQRQQISSSSSSRRRVRGSLGASHPPPSIQPSLTPDTEESSAFSSTAGVINQASKTNYDENGSGNRSRTRDDMSAFARRLMNGSPVNEEKNKSNITSKSNPPVLPSKSTACVTRARIRKAEEHATIVTSSTFPPLSQTNNNDNNNALNMFSYSPNKGNTTTTKINIDDKYNSSLHNEDGRNQFPHHASTLSIKTPSATSSRTQEKSTTDLNQQLGYHHKDKSQNLVHRIPLIEHSATLTATTGRNCEHQAIRLADTFTSEPSQGAESTHKILVTRSYEVRDHMVESIFYVSTSAILGSIVRTYLARIFGMDCELLSVHDFLSNNISTNICVTNGGQTLQTGGALFYDFPANVLGSFILGLITPTKERSRFPWLQQNHPLQRDDVLHASLGMGFCGT